MSTLCACCRSTACNPRVPVSSHGFLMRRTVPTHVQRLEFNANVRRDSAAPGYVVRKRCAGLRCDVCIDRSSAPSLARECPHPPLTCNFGPFGEDAKLCLCIRQCAVSRASATLMSGASKPPSCVYRIFAVLLTRFVCRSASQRNVDVVSSVSIF